MIELPDVQAACDRKQQYLLHQAADKILTVKDIPVSLTCRGGNPALLRYETPSHNSSSSKDCAS